MDEITILIIEDDEDIRESVKILLENEGFRHIAIYHQLQVVTDTASGSINSVLIDSLRPLHNAEESVCCRAED